MAEGRMLDSKLNTNNIIVRHEGLGTEWKTTLLILKGCDMSHDLT